MWMRAVSIANASISRSTCGSGLPAGSSWSRPATSGYLSANSTASLRMKVSSRSK
jgi:hypothetical protein